MKRWSIIEWLVYITDIWTACSNMSDNYSIFTVIHSLCEKPPPLSHTHQRLPYFLNQTMIIPKMTLNWSYQLHGNKTQRAPFLWMIWGGWTSFLTDKTITNNICNCIAFFYLQNYEHKQANFVSFEQIYLYIFGNVLKFWSKQKLFVHLIHISMYIPDFLIYYICRFIWHILW